MLSVERRSKILEIIKRNKSAKTSNLSELFNVSEMTVLRDLVTLEEEGSITRVHGGAILSELVLNEDSNVFREQINIKEKNKIAYLAIKLIKENDIIFLDGSTTNHALAKNLNIFNSLSVITNGVDILNEVKDIRGIDVIFIGGILDKVTMNCLGKITEESLKYFNINKAFISVTAFSLKAGLSEPNSQQAFIKRMVIENSNMKILCVDNSKFDKVALNIICAIKDLDIIITDKEPNNEYGKYFMENDIKIIY